MSKEIVNDTAPIKKLEVNEEVEGRFFGMGMGKFGHLVYLDKLTISANEVLCNKIKRAQFEEGDYVYVKRLEDKKGKMELPYHDWEIAIDKDK